MIGSPPEMVVVEFEIGFFHFWLAVNGATSEIEKGTDPQLLVPILRQELNQALDTMVSWRMARQHRDLSSSILRPPIVLPVEIGRT
jgi:hypothetical protein